MNKRLTYEEVKENIEKLGFKLLDDKYNAKSLKVQCKDNHIFYRNYHNLKINSICPTCKEEKRRLDKYNEIKEYCINLGFELLSNTYIDQYEKLQFKCDKGHIFEKEWKRFFSERNKCPICGVRNIKRRGRKPRPIKEVLSIFEQENYTIVNGIDEYESGKSKFTLRCSEGHEFKASFHHFYIRNQRCPYCAGVKKVGIEYCKKEFLKKEYIIIQDEYINSGIPIKYVCSKHIDKIQYMSWDNFKQGKNCKYCTIESMSGENHSNWQGGISELNNHLRYLLNDWRLESLKKYDFRCILTNINDSNLEVHHLKSFNTIVKDVLHNLNLPIRNQVCNYSEEEINSIDKEFLLQHKKLLGVPLREDLHMLFHQQYGYGDNTPKQFENFKTRLKQGEFDYFLEESNLVLTI